MLGPKVLSNGTASAAAARAIVITFATSIAAARRHSQQRQLEQLQQLEQQQQQSRSRILKAWSREYFEDRHANNAGQSDSYKTLEDRQGALSMQAPASRQVIRNPEVFRES